MGRKTIAMSAWVIGGQLALAGGLGAAVASFSAIVVNAKALSPDGSLDGTLMAVIMLGQLAFLVGFITGAIGGLTVGVAVHAALCAMRQRGLLSYSLLGAVGGLVFFVALVAVLSGGYNEASFRDSSSLLPVAPISGALAALIFWLIRRPDRDANSSVIPDTPQA